MCNCACIYIRVYMLVVVGRVGSEKAYRYAYTCAVCARSDISGSSGILGCCRAAVYSFDWPHARICALIFLSPGLFRAFFPLRCSTIYILSSYASMCCIYPRQHVSIAEAAEGWNFSWYTGNRTPLRGLDFSICCCSWFTLLGLGMKSFRKSDVLGIKLFPLEHC